MKKILIFSIVLVVLVLMGSYAFAQQQGLKNTKAGIENSNSVEANQNIDQNGNTQTQRQGDYMQEEPRQDRGDLIILPNQGETVSNQGETVSNQGETVSNQIERIKAKSLIELKTMAEDKKQELNEEVQELETEVKQKIYRNQNKVKEAVHSFLAAEDLVGGIGNKVSEIAREFNNSVEKTIKAESEIQTRNRVVRFLIGGVKDAAEVIEKEATQNYQRLERLKELQEQSDCTEEVKTMIQEQVENVKQEVNRLQELSQNEKKKKGIFGWVFNIFRK